MAIRISLILHVTALETDIDQLVYKLYDLTEEDIEIVEGRR